LLAHDLHRRLWIAALLAPALLIVSAFVILPLGSAFLYSLYSWNGLARGAFSGLENFRLVLFQEPFASWTTNALRNNALVFAGLMVAQNGTAFVIAFLLLKALPGHRFHRVAIFLPVVLSSVIVGAMWKLFLNPIFGLVNQALIAVGLASLAQPWLGQPSTALGSLVLVNTWHWLGFPALVYLAGCSASHGNRWKPRGWMAPPTGR
jgi:raffinose/stachyose/melibiose transport system permease protein